MLSSGQLNQNLLPLLHKVTFYDLVSLRLFTRHFIIELIFNGLQTGIPKTQSVITETQNFQEFQLCFTSSIIQVSVLFIPKFLNWQVWKFLDLSDLGIADQVSEAPS
ncbi:hypothetical protein ACFX13_031843 [Malus domestica]